tara:strand:+ start:653 stop:883 length:231 start_codon:yes stop_codon:yes gene_type:complete
MVLARECGGLLFAVRDLNVIARPCATHPPDYYQSIFKMSFVVFRKRNMFAVLILRLLGLLLLFYLLMIALRRLSCL